MSRGEDELMEAVWADPHCPVELVDTDSADSLGGVVPWPREWIVVPAKQRGEEVYLHPCPRHGQCRPEAEWFLTTLVEMRWRIWILEEFDEPSVVRVYLGQCQDCGRIYWTIVRP